MKEQLIQLMEAKPAARERKNKHKAVAYVLKKSFPVLSEIPLDSLEVIVAEASSADRAFRKILEDRVDLRGSDYGEAEKLSQDWQVANGYGGNIEIKVK